MCGEQRLEDKQTAINSDKLEAILKNHKANLINCYQSEDIYTVLRHIYSKK